MLKEYELLHQLTTRMTVDLIKLVDCLQDVLDQPSKDYLVTIKDVSYDIHKPSDLQERLHQKHLREKVSKMLVDHCLRRFFKEYKKGYRSKSYDFSHIWQDILCFTQGADPADHQFEVVGNVSDPVIGPDGLPIKSIALDLNNYQVRSQDNKLYEDVNG